jgi:hypothetical protein
MLLEPYHSLRQSEVHKLAFSPEMNIFDEAANNSANLQRRFDEIISPLSSTEKSKIQRFVDNIAANGSLGINMRQTVLIAFLTTDEYQNIYEWADRVSVFSKKNSDEILQERLTTFYERRKVFDDAFDDGKLFHYGALITTGIGAPNYGDFCIVLSRDVGKHVRIVYLLRDSLKTYFLPGPILDEDSIRHDVALDELKHILAGIKHCAAVLRSEEKTWGSLLCSNDDYIEAIFSGTMTSDKIREVRISKSDYDLYFYFAFDGFREKLDTATRTLIEGFAFVVKLLASRGINLQPV